MTILCLSDSTENMEPLTKGYSRIFFQIQTQHPFDHSLEHAQRIFETLTHRCNLDEIKLIIAEYVDSLLIIFCMRRAGYSIPTIFIPHSNPYPLENFYYFSLLAILRNPHDVVLCGTRRTAAQYRKMLNVRALPICTYGIDDTFQPIDKHTARRELGLQSKQKIILYTGRFAKDKNLSMLLDVYHRQKKRIPNLQLVISSHYIDPYSYNSLANKLLDVICFYKLTQKQLIQVYSAADLYTTPATSIFETWGRSPIEALRCHTPLLLPQWSGFEEYTLPHHGKIARVKHFESPQIHPFHYAQTDQEHYEELMFEMLTHPFSLNLQLSEWSTKTYSMAKIRKLIQELYQPDYSFFQPYPENQQIRVDYLSEPVAVFLDYLQVDTLSTLLKKAASLGIISRRFLGGNEFLNYLHHVFFRDLQPLT